ncbi:unnamed protein product [Clonostachys rosea]|uniref:Heterokaryon incompatibility domain-containing protein n=1 Tax=Bionectria ochroleuca TaxID=29856 RepID=A0ABY6UP52_BIOOC|nr:unnamed protein product [Clonostachys rosea]
MPRLPPPRSTNTVFYVYGPSTKHPPPRATPGRCSLCLVFEQDFVRPDIFDPPGTESDSYTYYIHHRNWESLKQSVDSGCKLCKLLYNGYLHTRHERRSAKQESDSLKDTEIRLLKSLSAETLGNFVFYVPYDYCERSGPLRVFFCHTDMFEESTLEAVSRHDSCAMAEFAVAVDLRRLCASEADFSLAASWLLDCQKNHECQATHHTPTGMNRQNPTRLLRLQPVKHIISLIDTINTQQYDYIALSHRWGQSKPAVTLISNLRARMAGISINTLPQTFQDAVKATYSLGYEYIWIDSLCIIQDDKADWGRECPRMSDVYRGAVLTIAGPAAADSSAGFLHKREFVTNEKYTPCKLQGIEGKENGNGELILWYPGCHRESTAETDVRIRRLSALDSQPDNVLQNRGWIMQEYLLSSRILYFGSFQMYFECGRASWFESTFHARNPSRYSNQDMSLKKSLNDHVGKFDILLEDWHDFVTRYSLCALTNPTDKLPAISSIAHSLDPLDQQSYYAGIWGSHLPASLLWLAPDDAHDEAQIQPNNKSAKAAAYIAPSWSWASTKAHIRFITLQRRQICPIEVVSCDTVLSGMGPNPDRFGCVNAGTIGIKGRLRRVLIIGGEKGGRFLAWRWPAASQSQYTKSSIKGVLETSRNQEGDGSAGLTLSGCGEFHPDGAMACKAHISSDECSFGKFNSSVKINDAGQRKMHMPPLQEIFALQAVIGSGYTYNALALERVPNMANTFRRIGCISFGIWALEQITWFEDQVSQTIEIV